MAASVMPSTSQLVMCLRPLVLWVRLLGIDLSLGKTNTRASKHRKWFIICYTITCLLANVSCQLNVIIYIFLNFSNFSLDGKNQLKTVTSSWNAIADFINYAIHGVGGHLILLTVIRSRWTNLVQSFQHLDKSLAPKFFAKLRCITIFSVAFIIFWVCLIGMIFNLSVKT